MLSISKKLQQLIGRDGVVMSSQLYFADSFLGFFFSLLILFRTTKTCSVFEMSMIILFVCLMCCTTWSAPSPSFFALSLSDDQDITSFPSHLSISTLHHNGVEYYARMLPEYRILPVGVDSAGFRYCRLSEPLEAKELARLRGTLFEDNPVRVQATVSKIFDFLNSITSCVSGPGTPKRTPLSTGGPTYRFCPFRSLQLLAPQLEAVHLSRRGVLVSVERGSDDTAHASLDGVFLGTYDDAIFEPRWNSEANRWEMPLKQGDVCNASARSRRERNAAESELRRNSATVIFRCNEKDPITVTNRLQWLVTRKRECEYVVELATPAVCDWHFRLNELYRTPMPCLEVKH